MASKEKGNEGKLSFRRALFPEHFKRTLQHRYFSSQSHNDSSASVDTSRLDKTEQAHSNTASSSQESSFEELPGCSPSKSKSLETDTTSTNTTQRRVAFMETPTKTPAKESSFEELPGCSPRKSKSLETDTASTNTTEGSVVFMETPTKTPPQELSPQSTSDVSQMAFSSHEFIASLSSQKHVRLEHSTCIKNQDDFGAQNTEPQYSVFRHHSSCRLLEHVTSHDNSSSLCSFSEGLHSNPELPPLRPRRMSDIGFVCFPRDMMPNSMVEFNRHGVSAGGLSTNMLVSKIFPSRMVDMEESANQRRFLSDKDTYTCPVCNQVFASYDDMVKHMAKLLPTTIVATGNMAKLLPTKIVATGNMAELLPTKIVATGNNNRVHDCKVCKRSFSRKDILTRHMRLHTGIKPYECKDCGQVFSRNDQLNTHKRKHTGEKPYKYRQCPYVACRRDMISRHLRTHYKICAKHGMFFSVTKPVIDLRKSYAFNNNATDLQDIHGSRYSQLSTANFNNDLKCSMPRRDNQELMLFPFSRGYSTETGATKTMQ